MNQMYLRIGRKSNTLDLGDLAEEGSHHVFISIKRKIADKQGIALRADGISMLTGSISCTSVGGGVFSRAGLGRIQSHGTAFQLEAIHLLEGGLSCLGSGEVNISKATRALIVLVGDNSGACEVGAVLERLIQLVVVNTPAKVSDEESRALLLGIISLGLLEGCGDLLLSLSLLGLLRLLLFGLRFSLAGLVRVRAIGLFLRVFGIVGVFSR